MIRPATGQDRDAICALHLASWQDSYGVELPKAVLRDDLPAYLKGKWARRRLKAPELVLVSEADGRVAGFVCVLTDHTPPLIDNLHVAPDLRGRGIGAALLRAAREVLWIEGHDRAYLTVLQSNPRAVKFYLAQGGQDGGAVDDILVGRPVKAQRIDFVLGEGSNHAE